MDVDPAGLDGVARPPRGGRRVRWRPGSFRAVAVAALVAVGGCAVQRTVCASSGSMVPPQATRQAYTSASSGSDYAVSSYDDVCRTPRAEVRITPASAIPTVTMAMIAAFMLHPTQSEGRMARPLGVAGRALSFFFGCPPLQ